MQEYTEGVLRLANGKVFRGRLFGYASASEGEAVFSTAMVGYPESLTDPSYCGQILCVSYPLVGNYGVPASGFTEEGISLNFESEKIWVRGLVISEYSSEYSHWDAVKSLDEWLREQKVVGIYGIDTRALTQELREQGSMLARIEVVAGETPASQASTAGETVAYPDTAAGETPAYQASTAGEPVAYPASTAGETVAYPDTAAGEPPAYPVVADPNEENLIAEVSCREVIRYGCAQGKTVCLVDCGVKHNILRCFVERGVNVVRVPWDYDFNQLEWDGLFISNGPGNPQFADVTVRNIQKAMEGNKPIFGICMGNQLLARAAGAQTYKLKYGHRSHNQPVRMVGSNRCFVTSQNHGFAVDDNTLGADWEPWFVNMNDGTNEGIRHKTKPFCSVQFHPEASSGPTDTGFLFDRFIEMMGEEG